MQDIVRRRKLLVTPHLLTEVTNLANSLPELLRRGFLEYLATYIPSFTEVFEEASALAGAPAFTLFGITDAAVVSLAARSLMITEDGPLRAYINGQGYVALGLDDLRRMQ